MAGSAWYQRMCGIAWNRKDAEQFQRHAAARGSSHWESLAALTEEIAAFGNGLSRQDQDRGIDADRGYGISRWRFLKELTDDTKTLSPGTFERKHGADLRECRRALKRLRQLDADGRAEDDEEVRKLAELFVTLWDRKMNGGRRKFGY